MALLSPGVQVSVIDQSNYTPAAAGSVPFILLATAENKASGAGTGIAPGTLAQNAGKVYLMTSQRDLLSTFGVPFFYNTTAGTPINGYELNEYGLLAAYSALGASNLAYVMRADVDLAALTASLTRPIGAPLNNTYWLDTTNSVWGVNEWNQTTSQFTNKTPLVITDVADLEFSGTVPLQSYGTIGQYAVVTTTDRTVFNPMYYKRGGPTTAQAPGWLQDTLSADDLYNSWVLTGSDEWKTAWPTVQGVNSPPTLTPGTAININDTIITVGSSPDNTLIAVVEQINDAMNTDGVYAADIDGKLSLYADSTASNDGSTYQGGVIAISNYVGTPLSTLGITTGQYATPAYAHGYNYNAPRWRSTDTQPRPTGSVFQQENAVNQGMFIQIKKYNSTLGTFVLQNTPVYFDDAAAIFGLDPSNGGSSIPVGSTYAQIDPVDNATAGLLILERATTGPTIITGTETNPSFTNTASFTIQATEPGSSTYTTPVNIVINGTTPADFVAAVSAANVQNVSATVNSGNQIVFTHAAGGDIILVDGFSDPLVNAGFTLATTGIRDYWIDGVSGGLTLSNWISTPEFTYTASGTAPNQDPAEGTFWYYSDATTADIMIQNNGQWRGYRTVTNDVRGYNLTVTNADGPIFSATAPTTQTNSAQSPLVYGDLWIDTADLENYPKMYRWQSVNGDDQWVAIDNTDQTTINGVLFADARWAPNGTTNPITDPIPPIATGTTPLITSSYLDLDAPDAELYPQGMLLWNTRRSGFNVKSFQVNYFNATDFPPPATLPTETNAWVTASANNVDGSPNMGRKAQRFMIVRALRASIDTSTTLREQQAQFNLLACPSYPELAPNMRVLNNDRGETGFTIVDTPLRLDPENVVNWATSADVYTDFGVTSTIDVFSEGNLAVGDAYSAAFYPSCTTTDLTGNIVVTAPSHMMLRTVIRNDAVAYPWFAPAGLRRGVIDNALQIGYLNGQTGEFQPLGVNQGLRDILYQNDINPITFIPGTGITNFGNHTLQGTATALDRINVARLVAYLRGRLEIIGNQYLFEPNDTITRQSITNQITSLMVDLVNKRGVYDYLVVCDTTNNTPATIDANELYVDIAIEPTKAVEFIYIPMRIQNTGTIQSQATA
jgi:hypothetical protein